MPGAAAPDAEETEAITDASIHPEREPRALAAFTIHVGIYAASSGIEEFRVSCLRSKALRVPVRFSICRANPSGFDH